MVEWRGLFERGEGHGWDQRSLWLFGRMLKTSENSGRAKVLVAANRKAARERNRSARDLPPLLAKHGYQRPTDKTHIRVQPHRDHGGLQPITIAKTSSDRRRPENQLSQIKDAMGLKRLL